MLFIGITGGVGAGKSAVLSILNEYDRTLILRADDIAHEVMAPHGECHRTLYEAFRSEGVFDKDEKIIPDLMAERIFKDPDKRALANSIIHPAVKQRVMDIVEEKRQAGDIDYLFLEAALLIEEGYDKLCDELWYIYASRKTRSTRLTETRGYDQQKIDAIMAAQLTREDFRKKCQRTIDNDGNLKKTRESIAAILSTITK